MTQQPRRRSLLRSKLTPFLWGVALVACLAQAVLLATEVRRGMDQLSSAPVDDVRWTLSQSEVELLRLVIALQEAREDPRRIEAVRSRFDVFYGRINTLENSERFVDFRASTRIADAMAPIRVFLDRAVPWIDADDRTLAAHLDELAAGADAMRTNVRQLALAGIPLFAHVADERRLNLQDTLRQLALVSLVLLLGLLATLAILQRVYARARAIASEERTMRNRFEAAIASSLDAVFVTDTDGCLLEFNGGAEAIFGYARDEVLGRRLVDVTIPPHRREQHLSRLAKYRETGDAEVVGKGRLRLDMMRRTGTVFPAEISVSAAWSDRQEVFVAFARDITVELAAEQELREARDRALEGQKAKARLLTVMSHEMRTPLNGILGSADLIARDPLTDRQERLLRAVRFSGELLLSHVNKVLELSRLDSDQAAPRDEDFDLDALVTGIAESLRPAAMERGNDLTASFPRKALGAVSGDKRAVQQCLVNLLGNAIKFTRDGDISVEVERVGGDEVEFRVADTGLGIPEDHLDRIFEEFVTIDTDYARENPGTGLGLPITRKLVVTMGGSIEVDSIEGEGSMFIMRIPLPRADAPVVLPTPDAGPVAVAPRHVLVVEDNRVNRMIIEDMLKELGCTFESAENGDDGIALARAGRFDLLLLDISMPGKDGIETLAGIRALGGPGAAARAVAITAHAGAEDRARILGHFDDMLTKPITLAGLAERLHGDAAPPRQDDTAGDFIRRFGAETFAGHLRELQQEARALQVRLAGAAAPDRELRQEAHKLAGSAAVLGQAPLRRALQRIETVDVAQWAERRDALLAVLERESDALATPAGGAAGA